MQQRQQERARHEAPPAAVAVPTAAGAPPSVRVIAGADVQELELAGRRVEEARAVAQAIFGIHPGAVALLDGQEVGDEQVLAGGQLLEFVKHAGQKGADGGVVVELAGESAVWRRDGKSLRTLPLAEVVRRAVHAGDAPGSWHLHPHQVRLMATRGGGRVTGVVIEMPPGPRLVRWMDDEGGEVDRRLAFPWVVLLVVFADGELSGMQQAFYRNAPLCSPDDELCLTNLLNVARGYDQESWICLVNLRRRLARLGWEERVRSVTAHFWQAAFNRSADLAEGNSYWEPARAVDKRVASAEAWEAATAANPYFPLEVRWRRASRPLRSMLEAMLEHVAPWRPIERVEQLVTLMQRDEA